MDRFTSNQYRNDHSPILHISSNTSH